MSRTLKLLLNFFLASIAFTYFVEILLLLLNPQPSLTFGQFFILFADLFLFYGPIWFIFSSVIFMLIQFFAERKYPIGIFTPPTIVYFFSFTTLMISIILYFNYEYYYNFIEGRIKTDFLQILFLNLAVVTSSILFVFFKRINRKWTRIAFITTFAFFVIHSCNVVTSNNKNRVHSGNSIHASFKPDNGRANFTPRRIRVVLMDSLSLSIINTLASDQKLLNFNEIIQKGVSGQITSFKPNMNLSMINSALTGLRPSQFAHHSHQVFKFPYVKNDFDVLPRYIFLRKSPLISITSYVNRDENQYLDFLRSHYETDNRKTTRVIRTPDMEIYSPQSLSVNNRFVLLFPDVARHLEENDPNYNIIKKYFFMDDYIKKSIPVLKDSSIFYCIAQLPGLDVVSKYLYRYHYPLLFESNTREDEPTQKYGGLLSKYYEYYDSILGNLMSTTGDDELLVIMSFYEYHPLPLWRRILVHLFGQKNVYAYIPLHAKGTILLYEKNALKKGYPLKNISIFDIYPTLLYYSGFQLPPDLPGEVIKEIFTDEFLLNNPIDLNPRESLIQN